MRAILEVLRSVGLWLATGGLGVRPLIVQVKLPRDPERAQERRATPRHAA